MSTSVKYLIMAAHMPISSRWWWLETQRSRCLPCCQPNFRLSKKNSQGNQMEIERARPTTFSSGFHMHTAPHPNNTCTLHHIHITHITPLSFMHMCVHAHKSTQIHVLLPFCIEKKRFLRDMNPCCT